MTRSDPEYKEILKPKIDDLNEAIKARNSGFNDTEKSFIREMKVRIFFSEKQIAWIERLWERI